MESVPVLLFNGPVGVGKSTILAEASHLLRQAGVPHAAVDLAWIGTAWPAPPDDRWNERLIHRNLACLWANFRESGAKRLLLARVLEDRSLLRHVEAAVPGARITVVRLRAPKGVVEARIRHREEGRDPSWFLAAAGYLVDVLERSDVADHIVENDNRPVADVAAEALRAAGWLP
jgi:adenylylsulfate kinase